jgi:hypothetical protein
MNEQQPNQTVLIKQLKDELNKARQEIVVLWIEVALLIVIVLLLLAIIFY